MFCVAIPAASAQDAAQVAEQKAGGKQADEKAVPQKKPVDKASHVTAEAVFADVVFDQYVNVLLDVDSSLGAQVTPADDALRAQLDLPKDQGLVVTSVQDGGPADKAGLQKHDVLLAIGGKPVGNSDALRQQLKDAGEKAVPVLLLRSGKKLTIEITPHTGSKWDVTVFRTDGSGFWIGVSVAAADETLRAQLRLPEKRGLVVTKVEADAPAAKAGILVHDVLLELGGRPLATIEDLNSQIQEVGEKPATMKLLRSGQPQSLQVTPARRAEVKWAPSINQSVGTVRFWNTLDNPATVVYGQPLNVVDAANLMAPAAPREARAELADLVKEVRKLNERIEKLDRSLKSAEEKAGTEKAGAKTPKK
jgi:serine protease Do